MQTANHQHLIILCFKEQNATVGCVIFKQSWWIYCLISAILIALHSKEEYTMTLGQRIYRHRRANGLSQEDLAESLNVSRQSVSKWETDGSTPDLDKMVALSELFGITLDELVKGEAATPVKQETSYTQDGSKASSTTSEEKLSPPHKLEPFWCARRIIGVVLLGISLVFALFILFFTWDVIGMLAITAPLWLCGVICLTIRCHTVICCCWGALIGISSFLSLQTIFSFYNFNLITSIYAFLRFDNGPYVSGISSEPLYLIIHVFFALVVITLMVVTVMRFGKDPICVTKKTIKLYCIAAGVYLLLDVGIQCFNMEVTSMLFVDNSNPWMDGWHYILFRDIQICLANLRNCMRPMAITAIASVIVSFCREKTEKY